MNTGKFIMIAVVFLLSLMFFSCVSSTTQSFHVVGRGSPLSSAVKNIVFRIKSVHDFSSENIQISANNFWEEGTKINLPFSSVLAQAFSSGFSQQGADITLQEIGTMPLKLCGSYLTAGDDVLITVRLRRMGETAGTDLAVADSRVSMADLDKKWFDPEFERIARSLVNLLESDYSGMLSLKVYTPSFIPGTPAQPELAIGDELSKYMKDAFAASAVFRDAGDSYEKADAVLKGEYSELGTGMVFHLSIADKKTGRHLAGAKISTSLKSIPFELLRPEIQSLNDLAAGVAKLILQKYSLYLNKRGRTDNLNKLNESGNPTETCRRKNSTHTLYIGRNGFHDSDLKAVTPFGRRIAGKLKEKLSDTALFTVTNDPLTADLTLSGHYFRDKGKIYLSVDLDSIGKTAGRIQKEHIASVQVNFEEKFCTMALFRPDLQSYTDYLMNTLENEAVKKLAALGRTNIVIYRFRFENNGYFSKLSDYLYSYFLNYFSSSAYFVPVTDNRGILIKSFTKKTRSIVAAKSVDATIASVSGAPYYVSGSLWPDNGGSIEIRAKFSDIKGRVLASGQVSLKDTCIDKKWLTPPGQEPALMPASTESSIKLFTQKGRNNLSFKEKEKIVFFVKANKDVYITIFNSDALHNVVRIYPNDFEKRGLILRTGEIAAIPNKAYGDDFEFKVQSPTGNEMVFAFASNAPLPVLPGSTDAAFGMKQVKFTPEQIIEYFTDYTKKRGLSLAWDFLPVFTTP